MKPSFDSSFAGSWTMALTIGALLAACGGSFAQNTTDDAGGGGGSTPGQGGAGGPGNVVDAAVSVDGNDSRCPPTAPLAYSACASDQFICDYDDAGCPRRFTCIAQGSVVAGAGVGGAYPGTVSIVWIPQSPMPGDVCGTPGKICNYPDSYPGRLVCTEVHQWEATSSTTTEGTTTTTTYGSTSFTVGTTTGQGGAAPDENSGGAGGLGGAP